MAPPITGTFSKLTHDELQDDIARAKFPKKNYTGILGSLKRIFESDYRPIIDV